MLLRQLQEENRKLIIRRYHFTFKLIYSEVFTIQLSELTQLIPTQSCWSSHSLFLTIFLDRCLYHHDQQLLHITSKYHKEQDDRHTKHISVLTFTIFPCIWRHRDGEAGGVIWQHYKQMEISFIVCAAIWKKAHLFPCLPIKNTWWTRASCLSNITNLQLMPLRLSQGISCYYHGIYSTLTRGLKTTSSIPTFYFYGYTVVEMHGWTVIRLRMLIMITI